MHIYKTTLTMYFYLITKLLTYKNVFTYLIFIMSMLPKL